MNSQYFTSQGTIVRFGFDPSWMDLFFELYNKTDLKRGNKDQVQQAFINSQVVASIWQNDQPIAIGRAISDFKMYSGIYDVVVDPLFQKQGLGKIIMQNLLERLQGTCVFLTSTFGNEQFYKNLGFRFHKLIGIHPSQIFKSRLPTEQANHALTILNEKSQKDAASIPLFNEIHSICTYLKMNGCRLAVWTSRDLVSAKLVLNEAGIGHFFDFVISGDCVLNRKPHPEGIEKIQKLFLCEPHEMVMEGDHDHDMEAARSFGAQPLRASWHNHWDHDNCSKSNKQFYCTSEFRQWIQSSFKKLGYI